MAALQPQKDVGSTWIQTVIHSASPSNRSEAEQPNQILEKWHLRRVADLNENRQYRFTYSSSRCFQSVGN